MSVHESVRAALVDRQRSLARAGGVVMDGRDIGTVVLADAELKVYLDASLEERARRRHDELIRRGATIGYAEVRDALAQRDHRDMTREMSPLRRADDAVLVDSTHLTIRQAIEHVIALAVARGATRAPARVDVGPVSD